jgi:hypothetical protein
MLGEPGASYVVPDRGFAILHGSNNAGLTLDDIQIVRTEGQKQGKKGRVYGGFYGTRYADAAQAEDYARMMGGDATIYSVRIRPGTRVLNKAGDITRLSDKYIADLVEQGYGVVVGKDPRGRTEYVVIDKSAIESVDSTATGNRGTFDPNDPNVLNQSVSSRDAAIENDLKAESDDAAEINQGTVPKSVDAAATLDSTLTLAKSQVWQKGRDLKVAMQAAVQALARAAGVDVGAPSPQTTEYLIRVGVKDALFALEQNANAVGWYDLKTRQALAIMSLIHPEIATDETAQLAFVWAMAVTSNGLKVDKNFEIAEKVYREYKRTGKMPTDAGIGTAGNAINKSLAQFNDLLAKWGPADLRKFMLSDFTVSEITGIDKALKPGGEHADVVVKGAAILGPKIGNGFFSNLFGNFDSLTMDRWLIRT